MGWFSLRDILIPSVHVCAHACECVRLCACVHTHVRARVSLALAQASFRLKEEKPAATGSRKFAGAFTGSWRGSLPPSIRLSLPD